MIVIDNIYIVNDTMDPQIKNMGSNTQNNDKRGDFMTLMQYGVRKDGYNYFKERIVLLFDKISMILFLLIILKYGK